MVRGGEYGRYEEIPKGKRCIKVEDTMYD